MPLQVRPDSVFCLEFIHTKDDFNPYECTIPELIHQKAKDPKTAFVFDSEKLSFSYAGLKTEIDALAAGFLATGLRPDDRILICGYNNHSVLVSALAASRAGLIFALASPNISHSGQLKHLLLVGEFRAVVLFAPNSGGSDFVYNLLLDICPELKASTRGKLAAKALPKLTHVILGDEDHKHAGTFTLSDIFGKSNKQRIEKLPNFKQWNCHRQACIAFTLGATGPPKAIALTHYQLINGCRIAANTIGITKDATIACALPIYRIPVFCLIALTPFFFNSCTVIPEPSPVPRNLFTSINKYGCTNLLSNAIALRLLLKVGTAQRVKLPSVHTVILLGDRVSTELLATIEHVLTGAKKIAVGMLCTEVGSVPILSDKSTNMIKSIGKVLDGFQVDVKPIEKLVSASGQKIGELRVRALEKTKFLGYGPTFNACAEWIDTGDIASISRDGNVEIITNLADLVYDRQDNLIEHWKMERLLAQYEGIKGVQILQVCHGAPICCVVVPKKMECVPEFIKTDTSSICRKNKLYIPDQLAIVNNFPIVGTRIQKYVLREMLKKKMFILY